jgi:hypothetical protein
MHSIIAFVLQTFVEWLIENLLTKISPETIDPFYKFRWNIRNANANNDSEWIRVYFDREILRSRGNNEFWSQISQEKDLRTDDVFSS